MIDISYYQGESVLSRTPLPLLLILFLSLCKCELISMQGILIWHAIMRDVSSYVCVCVCGSPPR